MPVRCQSDSTEECSACRCGGARRSRPRCTRLPCPPRDRATRPPFVVAKRIAGLPDQHFVLHRHLVEPDAEPRAIGLRLADRVVVHLPVDVLAGGDALADVGPMRVDAASGHERQQLRGSWQAELRAAGAAAAVRAGRADDSSLVVKRRPFRQVGEVDAGVMNDGAVTRTQLNDFGEAIDVERHLRVEVLDRQLALGGNGDLERHLDHEVRLAAERPALREFRRRRQVGGVAARRARIHPAGDGFDLLLGKAAIVPHRQAVLGIGAPRRHLTRHDLRFDRLRPRPCIVVRHQRHRGDFAGAMAAGALLGNDRRHVLRERWRVVLGGGDAAVKVAAMARVPTSSETARFMVAPSRRA